LQLYTVPEYTVWAQVLELLDQDPTPAGYLPPRPGCRVYRHWATSSPPWPAPAIGSLLRPN